MIKKIFSLLGLFCGLEMGVSAQTVLKAKNVQLVVDSGITVSLRGGVQWDGSAQLINSGSINLNPGAGNENWTDNTSGVMATTYKGIVSFNSTHPQTISGSTTFATLTIDNSSPAGVSQNGVIEVTRTLNLNSGIIASSGSSMLYVSNPAVDAVQSNSAYVNSWINGKLRRAVGSSAVDYMFPLGTSAFAPLKLNKTNAVTSDYITEYVPSTPSNTSALDATLGSVSNVEHWKIKSYGVAAGPDDDAIVTLSWRANSNVGTTPADWNLISVAQYINSAAKWQESGGWGSGLASGAANFGYVTTASAVSSFDSSNQVFTIGGHAIKLAVGSIAKTDALLWPNPAKDNISISVPFDKGTLNIFDLKGQQVYHATNMPKNMMLPIGTWVPGTYFIRLTGPHNNSCASFVKE